MKRTNEKQRAPETLEIGLPVMRKISLTHRSENSDPEKCQISNHTSMKANEASTMQRTEISPNTKRRMFRNRSFKKQNKPLEALASMIRGRSVDSNSITVESETHSSDITATTSMRSAHLRSDIANLTGSYEIYSIQTRQPSSIVAKEDKSITNEPKIRNHHIKNIRRGLPSTVATNFRRRSMSLYPQEIKFSQHCICYKGADNKRRCVAWMFSIVAAFLCVVFPLLSFSADVSFFLMCKPHYNDTMELLNYVKKYQDAPVKYLKPEHKEDHHNPGHKLSKKRHHSARHRSDRDASWFEQNVEDMKLNDIARNRVVKRAVRHQKSAFIITSPRQNASEQSPIQQYSSFTTDSPLATASSNATLQYRQVGCAIPTEERKPVCSNQSYLLEYMSTPTAARLLEAHRHVTTDVYEPVFILGSFPSLILCIFTRLIVLTTDHNHFLSAYVINLISMPLQLITGALAVHSASFHVGQDGFECWKCALKENCSITNPLQWLEDQIGITLIITTVAKFLDGAAGGCILFVVLLRIMWVRPGHVSCWWYVGRSVVTIASFTLCVAVSATMVLTPSLGVFRLEMIGKTTYFPGKETICFLSMVLLIIGMSAWGITFLFLLIYCIYRTHVFCRISEHLTAAM